MDNRFNIQLLFNIPKTLFLEKFNIPSLKNSLEYFNKWFEEFFAPYNNQFTTPLDKQKVYNSLKYQIRQHFISQLKYFLPNNLEFIKPNNLTERRQECYRHTNFHILTCTNSKCIFSKEKQHDNKALLGNIFKTSFETFPKTDKDQWKSPNIDTSLFHIDGILEASFKQKFPTDAIDKLAQQAEDFVCKENSVEYNSKRRNYYFYQYFNAFNQIAAQNHNIDNFSREQAIDYLTSKPIPTDFLARVLTYYDLIKNQTPTFIQIRQHFNNKTFLEAESFLKQKFNISFQTNISINDNLFFSLSSQEMEIDDLFADPKVLLEKDTTTKTLSNLSQTPPFQ
jgi:hypothetical protein